MNLVPDRFIRSGLPFLSLIGTLLLAGATQVNADCGTMSSSQKSILPSNLTEVGLQKLLSFDLEVVSPAKKAQRFGDVAAAIYVLTQEDIHRSGVTHIADALALVPGLQVAHIDNHRWAITARGLNSTFSHRLLVLIDGASVFTPGFNGVWWDEQDLNLEDVARVEVIRGPGASIWGTNAVNGVINIITCSAEGTQGGSVGAFSGKEQRFGTQARYGGTIGPSSFYRVYGKYKDMEHSSLAAGTANGEGGPAYDAYQTSMAGVRLDSHITSENDLTIKLENAYQEKELTTTVPSLFPPYTDTKTYTGPKATDVTTFLAKYSHEASADSSYYAQLDYTHENQAGKIFPIRQDTLHAALQHRTALFTNHDYNHGFEYRLASDHLEGNFGDKLIPASDTTHLFTYSGQDEITIIPDTFRVILGVLFEHNSFTGFDYMPTGRLLWTPDEKNSIWFSVSRALASPSRIEEAVSVPVFAAPDPTSGLPIVGYFNGSDGIRDEELISYQIGYRSIVSEQVTFDFTTYIHDYDNLTSDEPKTPTVGILEGQTSPAIILPLSFENKLRARSYGAELSADIKLLESWKLRTGYTYFRLNFDQRDSLDTASIAFFEHNYPQHQVQVHSMLDLSSSVQLDVTARYVDRMLYGNIPAYIETGARLAWKATKNLELELIGQNLIHRAHQEFKDTVLPPPPTEVERQYYVRGTYHF